jgi:D-glycero-alpha-D-manno-heptose 1-phosphate guanylyltransferase
VFGFEQITAAILAGGLGTRLRAIVRDRPKALAEISGKPFLSYLLDYLSTSGIRSVVLCTGFFGDQIQRRFREKYGMLDISYSQESSPLGTAGALRLALPLMRSESVLIMNGDSFCDANLKEFWQWHYKQDADASVLLVEMTDTKRYGRVIVNSDQEVLRFEEKDDKEGPGWINAGIYLIKRRLLEKIPEGIDVSLEREMFPSWVGERMFGYSCSARFLDIGTPESYERASEFFSEDMLK